MPHTTGVKQRLAKQKADAKAQADAKALAHAKATVAVGQRPVFVDHSSPALPFSHDSDLSLLKAYEDDKWLAAMTAELLSAKEVFLSTLNYDDAALHEVLVQRLSANNGFKCTVVVDKALHYRGLCQQQAKRLRELRRLKAAVYLGKGYAGWASYTGVMHRKGVLLDNAVLYSGGANSTSASRVNRELNFRMEGGTAVKEAQDILLETLTEAVLLKSG